MRTLFAYPRLGAQLSPFLLLDYAGPVEFPPTDQRLGVGEHPHRGFETVTIVYDGEVEHRDSSGGGGRIGPGDVQWMTAASGLVHEEFHGRNFARHGGKFEMVQLWVNLPAKDKMSKPGYQTLLAQDIPTVSLPDGAGSLRMIAGQYGDAKGPARTFTPINVWDLRLVDGKPLELDLPEGQTLSVLVLAGNVEVNGTESLRAAQTALFSRSGGGITLQAAGDAKLLVLAGEPINEPVVAQGPFVMNTEAEIRQAMMDYRTGRFGAIA